MKALVTANAVPMKNGAYMGAVRVEFQDAAYRLRQELCYEATLGEDGGVNSLKLRFKGKQIFGFVLPEKGEICPVKFFVMHLFALAIEAAVKNPGAQAEDTSAFDHREEIWIAENLCLVPPVISARPKL